MTTQNTTTKVTLKQVSKEVKDSTRSLLTVLAKEAKVRIVENPLVLSKVADLTAAIDQSSVNSINRIHAIRESYIPQLEELDIKVQVNSDNKQIILDAIKAL